MSRAVVVCGGGGTAAEDELAASLERVRDLLDRTPPGACVLVDFDDTLLLSNSTELRLDRARPRVVAAVLNAVLLVGKPWRVFGGTRTDFATQDAWRTAAIGALSPGLDRRWRADADSEVAERLNRPLVELLLSGERRLVVATYAQRRTVAPLLAATPLRDAELIAGPDRGPGAWRAWRARGKTAAVRDAIGDAALRQAVVVTDDDRDQPLIDAAAGGVVVRWPGTRSFRAFDGVYLPLIYLSRVKRQGQNALVREVLLDDFALLLLALFAGGQASPRAVAGLALACLAFFCVYEIGYRENDRLDAAHSETPRLSDNFFRRPGLRRDPGVAPWLWATGLSAAAVALLQPDDPWAAAAGWAGVLVGVRIAFTVYNHLDETSRVYVFPLLQVAKTFGFLTLFTTHLAGGVLFAAQVLRRWAHYACYRAGGDGKHLPSHVSRLMIYVLLAAAAAVTCPDAALLQTWPFWAGLAWLTLRAALQLTEFARNVRWRRTRPDR